MLRDPHVLPKDKQRVLTADLVRMKASEAVYRSCQAMTREARQNSKPRYVDAVQAFKEEALLVEALKFDVVHMGAQVTREMSQPKGNERALRNQLSGLGERLNDAVRRRETTSKELSIQRGRG